MAGYLFTLDSDKSLENCFESGMYSTKLSEPSAGRWKIHHEGTFADFSSMKPGDNIYFFIDRRIYGIGELVEIRGDCRYLNYPNSNKPETYQYKDIQEFALLDDGTLNSAKMRFTCFFKPSPFFFEDGVDMDEVLSSSPSQFRMIRAFWKLSFIKFPDDENQALKNIILRRSYKNDHEIPSVSYETHHRNAENKISERHESYKLCAKPFLEPIANEDGSIRHEMAIEAALISQLSENDNQTINTFGAWDYITHQVVASPFKPIDYMDKMDVFGYRFISGQKPAIAKFLVAELKKNEVREQDVLQLMKYVDWVKSEYAFNDYSMIDAYLVGYSFNESAIIELANLVERNYIQGFRPAVPAVWSSVKLVSYKFNHETMKIDFEIIADAKI